MSTVEKDLAKIAARHGVDLKDVRPPSRDERRAQLVEILSRTDVPFPVSPEHQAAYLADFDAGRPFGVGSLSGESVELGKYANFQEYDKYTIEEHLAWACLVADQQQTKHRYACREYLEGESLFEIGGAVIPDYYKLNARAYQQTGWQLATVNMIIPANVFFTCHCHRFFPVTTFMRPLETDYLQEPDIGHDVAGHVATFAIPAVAQVMKNHGDARNIIYAERDEKLSRARDDDEVQAIKSEANELLFYAGRIYWFTVEFGLVMQDGEVRDFGAGILSSPGETAYSIDSPISNRVLIDPSDDRDLLRLATTDYLISEFQKTYFVMESFELLESLTPERIVWAAKTALQLPHYTWREVVPGDTVINVGTVATSVNEKYLRLRLNLPFWLQQREGDTEPAPDRCLVRTAVRNLRMKLRGDLESAPLDQFKVAPPAIPDEIAQWFAEQDDQGTFADVEMAHEEAGMDEYEG